jgi:hypothetical protein
MKLTSQSTSLILILASCVLAVIAFCHSADAGSKGQMFTFAGGIITGAFALLRGEKEDPPPGTKVATISTTDSDPKS